MEAEPRLEVLPDLNIAGESFKRWLLTAKSLILLVAEVPREELGMGGATADDSWVVGGAVGGASKVGREGKDEEEVVERGAGFAGFGVLACRKELSERRLEISCDCGVCVSACKG